MLVIPGALHNPFIVAAALIMWGFCLATLVVPRWRSRTPIALFFDSNTPMGRGDARAATMRTLFVFAIMSFAVLANLPVPPTLFTAIGFTLGAVAVLSSLLWATLVFFNWPRFLAPQKQMRSQPGAIREWIDRLRKKKKKKTAR